MYEVQRKGHPSLLAGHEVEGTQYPVFNPTQKHSPSSLITHPETVLALRFGSECTNVNSSCQAPEISPYSRRPPINLQDIT